MGILKAESLQNHVGTQATMLGELATSVWSTVFDSSSSDDESTSNLRDVVARIQNHELIAVAGSSEDIRLLSLLQHTVAGWCWTPPEIGEHELLKSSFWKSVGFQREEPISDFRACGKLAL